MIDAPLALAFTAGLVGVVNPCGFALLPAYLSFFVGADATERESARRSLQRGLVSGLAVSAGFAGTFVVLGSVGQQALGRAQDIGPKVSIVVGAVLVVMGVAFLRGWQPKLAGMRLEKLRWGRGPRLTTSGRDRTFRSMALFGVSYAVTSIGCAITPFLIYAGSTANANLVSQVAASGAYAVGAGLLLTSLSVSLAVARRGLVTRVRSVLPHVQRISGALLVCTGAYVAYYGWFEIRQGSGASSGDALVERVWDLSFAAQDQVAATGALRIGLVLAAVVGLAAALAYGRGRSRDRARPTVDA